MVGLGSFALCALIGLSGSALGQNLPKPTRLPELHQPNGDTALRSLWLRLDTLVYQGRGSINIIHIGGSHVQAGMLTDAVRRELHAAVPGVAGGIGWLFPYALAGTNGPRSVGTTTYGTWTGQRCSVPQHRGPWGFSGIRAYTGDSAGFTIYHKELPLRASGLRLFFAQADSLPQPQILGPVARTERRVDGMDVWFSRPVDSLSVAWVPRKGRADTLSLEGLLFRPMDPNGLRYHAVGVNGAATHSFLKAEGFTRQLAELPPDLVVFGLGINDAHKARGGFDTLAYERNYDSLVAWIRGVRPHAEFIWLTNNDALYQGSVNPHGAWVQRCMYRLAARHDGAVFDFYALMGGSGSIRQWMAQSWARPDGIHLSQAGYEAHAQWFGQALLRAYLRHQEQRSW